MSEETTTEAPELLRILRAFTYKHEDHSGRYDLCKPWAHAGYAYATDGRIIVRGQLAPGAVPNVLELEDYTGAIGGNPPGHSLDWVADYWPKSPTVDLAGVRRLPATQKVACAECEGTGRWGQDWPCEECDGTGQIEIHRPCLIEGRFFGDHYLALLRAHRARLYVPLDTPRVRELRAQGVGAPARFELPATPAGLAGTLEGLLMGRADPHVGADIWLVRSGRLATHQPAEAQT